MNTIGPLVGTFGFFATLFFIGKLLQDKEKKKRLKHRQAEERIALSLGTYQSFQAPEQKLTAGSHSPHGGLGQSVPPVQGWMH